MRLVDTHCHLQAPAFAEDRAAVLAAARHVGVERIVAPGWDLATSRASVALSAQDLGIGAAVGVHPHAAAEVGEDGWAEIVALAADPHVQAIGETGLDYDRAFAPREIQLANLRRNLALAGATGKPAILHCRSKPGLRDAQDDLIAELRAAHLGSTDAVAEAAGGRASSRPPALLHSFSGPLDYAAAALELGLMISFSGLVFRAGEEVSAAAARLVPDDRLLVETDSPWLAPPGAPRRRNEPRWVEVTARWLAEQRGVAPEALGEQLVANHDRTFGLAG
ncbi:MAG TPA: TatD family hydrolase [Candidatus Limnocylindrales bacterium]|nr:TatD family hydrolase [Candidatus Limnocylindrales bacterium]